MPNPDRERSAGGVQPERWGELERLVDGALDRPPAERAAYLITAAGKDRELHEAAVRLLEACLRGAGAEGLFATPAAAFAAPLLAELQDGAGPADAVRRAALAGTLSKALTGRYEVVGELGRGGMATVFRARDVRHDRAVAVKVVEPHAGPGSARFLREIRTAARLTHPHVLGVHDSGEADGLLYYVMPCVEGETLRERLAREGALPVAAAVRLLRELADALAYAHARGVVHCDLKPENVLLSEGHAVVADFGIAKAVAAVAADETAPAGSGSGVLGTPGYMAPEQASGGTADHRSDLYALGVIGYEVLTGTHPFPGRSPGELLLAHRTEVPVPLGTRRADAPPALADVVMRLLAKDPAQRPPSARSVLLALERATVTTPRSTRRALLVAVLATVVLLAIAWAGWRTVPPAGDAAPDLRSLAVLPFANAGGAPGDEYFSDGITDELAHALGAMPGVQLAGRASSYAFKGRAATAQEVRRILHVGAFVSGTVRRSGERLRVSAELVSTADGRVLWDSVFESGTGDLFEVQDELVRAIRASLAPALDARGASAVATAAGRGTTDQEAYDLYLQGRYHFLERGTENVVRAISFFRRAIEQDSSFARAHAGLAFAYGVLPSYIPSARDSIPDLVAASAGQAFALDSTLADARLAMGLALDFRLHLTEARHHYEAALAREPSNAFGHHLLGFLLAGAGRTDEAITELRRATQLDPLAKSAGTALAGALAFARRFPESIAESRRVLALDSTFPLANGSLGMAQAFAGQPDSAALTLERGRYHPEAIMGRSILLYALAVAGRWPDATRLRAEIREMRDDPSLGTAAAFAELVFGNREPLVRLLGTEAGQRGWYDTHVGFGCNPLLDPLWPDVRFRAAMAALDIPPCTLAGSWPFTAPSPGEYLP